MVRLWDLQLRRRCPHVTVSLCTSCVFSGVYWSFSDAKLILLSCQLLLLSWLENDMIVSCVDVNVMLNRAMVVPCPFFWIWDKIYV